MDIGKRLIELREQQNLTTNALAMKSGVSQSAVDAIEKGKASPQVDTIKVLCDTLNISLHDFFKDPNDPTDRLDKAIRGLSPEQKKRLLHFLESL